MVHKAWSKKVLHGDSITFKSGRKFISMHRMMGLYWIDYGLVDGNVLGTLAPVKTKKKALEQVEEAKKEFLSRDG